MVRPAVTLPGERWLRKNERAGPLDTEVIKRQGGGEKASVRRTRLSRLCLVAVRSMAFAWSIFMENDSISSATSSLGPSAGASVDVWGRRRRLLRELVFESLPLLFALFVLGFKYRVLLFKFNYLTFKRLVLLFRQRKSFSKNDGGPVLSDKAFNVTENAHAISPCDSQRGSAGVERPNV